MSSIASELSQGVRYKLVEKDQNWIISTPMDGDNEDLQTISWLRTSNQFYTSGSYVEILDAQGNVCSYGKITDLYFSLNSFHESKWDTIRFNIHPVKIDFKAKVINKLNPDKTEYYHRNLGNVVIGPSAEITVKTNS